MLKSFSFLALAAMILPLAGQAEEAKTQIAPKGVYFKINPEEKTISFYQDKLNNRTDVQEAIAAAPTPEAKRELVAKITAKITTKENHITTMTLEEFNALKTSNKSEATCWRGGCGGWGWRGGWGWGWGGGWWFPNVVVYSGWGWGGCGWWW